MPGREYFPVCQGIAQRAFAHAQVTPDPDDRALAAGSRAGEEVRICARQRDSVQALVEDLCNTRTQ